MSGLTSGLLRAPFPWYGGKSRVADRVWGLLGSDVGRYIEPFAGSLAVLLNRPGDGAGLEVANDTDGFIVNVWRALKHQPELTIEWASDPRTELDLTARHLWLVNEGAARLRPHLMADPEWHDPQVAGWWLYGIAMWIGTGWCRGDGPWTRRKILGDLADDGRGVRAQLPHLGSDGQGVHAKLPHLGDDGRGVPVADSIRVLAQQLSRRLRGVLVTSGDFERVLSDSAMRAAKGVTGVFLDPPYRQHTDEYASQDDVEGLWQRLSAWCETNGGRSDLRVVLCGYDGDWDAPDGWQTITYTGRGTSSANRTRERLWASPSCTGEMGLF